MTSLSYIKCSSLYIKRPSIPCWLVVCLYICISQSREYFTHKDTSPLQMEGCRLYLRSLCFDASSSCDTCCDRGHLGCCGLMRRSFSFDKLFKGRGPGIKRGQSKNVGKIHFSMQLSHLSIILENT